ncbi:MAG: ATP-binding cassette domain-containing protein [Planctomycetales bacterium]|nr:ATP-binding cassette domain-containing protein [Planctomycetales bacterium]NIM09669.1 ATP-binding cassette domain-containing protein [Planctomycetales bacterium]NIN09152.1 ATP-binding cassette domain-containing protein [Planctomycetales bacterium]NIN78259.1 ATP-binding cassette domain-containing protein [Planctomycetales bacterium]NIO35450.1 ATP-binding cassette domain-containing protein [Planctomycetales bacterium]
MIELQGVHRYFGSTRAVNDVSFEVQRGEVFGFIGPNGAGKTTSMRILATLDTPTRGDAFVDGFSVVEDPDRVRSRLGFMPDYFGTYPNVNVSEYLDFFARAYGLRGSARTRAVDHVLDFTLLSSLAQKPTDSLSKGMKQRLCLGRAMIHDPAVLVLDEPAAGLDPRARIELRDMIGRLAADGKAVLVSSHILTELSEMCHRVGIIEQGRLLAVGTVEEMRQRMEPHATVRLRVLGGAAEVGPWLEQRADVAEFRLEGEVALVSHRGDRAAEVALLRDLIQAGFPVAEFRAETKSLEDVFMHLTNGRVQ